MIYPLASTIIDQAPAIIDGMETIGDRLEDLRTCASMTKVAMAEAGGTSKQHYGRIVSGLIKQPSAEILAKWAQFFDVRMEWIVSGTSPKKAHKDATHKELNKVCEPSGTYRIEIAQIDPALLRSAARVASAVARRPIDIEQDAELLARAYDEISIKDGITPPDVIVGLLDWYRARAGEQ